MSHSASSTDAVPKQQKNLPIELNSFIGRQREVSEVLGLLTLSPLVTLTGAAGCGKTRLALHTATNVSGQYRDGVYWVELAPLVGPHLVPQAVAKAVNAANQPGGSTAGALLHVLRDKELLLVLDNCEHLLSACSQLVATLLTLPDLSILATSREPLGIPSERRYPVSPLALPPASTAVDDIGQYDAVRLFVERARAIVPSFELTAENADVVAHICQKLDGIPLALELASVRINVLSAEEIATRLDNRFELLAATSPVTLSQHDTLYGALDWSYELLSVPQQIILRRMSVFAGGCALVTAETICAGDGIERKQVLSLLGALVEKSLVVAHTLKRSEARYTLLETIRQYAREKLAAAGERSRLRNRHLRHFLQLAEETRPKLSGQYQRLWLDWLEGEYDNLRAALSWSLESGDIGSGLRIAIAIYEFWMIRDYAEEALGWIEQLLARADENVSPVVRANALAYATFLTGFCGKSGAQAAYGRKAAELAKSLGAEGQRALAWATAGQAYSHGRPGPLPSGGSARAWALGAEAYSARAEGDYETELDIYKQLIHLHRQAGERSFLSFTLIKASFAAWSLGEHEEARAMVDEGLPLLRETGNPYQVAMTLNGSGDLARCEGDYTRARADYQESIALLREIGAVRDLASSLHNLGYTYLHLGNLERAHALFNESMRLQHTQQNTPGVAECLMGFGAMAVVCGIPAAGARLLAAAIAIGGERVTMTWAATRMEYERYLALIRTNLSEQEFRVEQASGRVLSLTQAVAYARKLPLRAAAQRTGKKLDDLTPREREVATLVGRALSNQEIAEELVVSKRTVETHISNIRSKLGFSKRAQMVRWALENGLVDAIE